MVRRPEKQKRRKGPPFGGFRSKTATWIQKWLKKSVGASESTSYNRFSRRRRRGVVIEICIKYPGGPLETGGLASCIFYNT
jgi:hypothetical protein